MEGRGREKEGGGGSYGDDRAEDYPERHVCILS